MLHHRHIGELVVSLLLIQDLIAILALIILSGRGTSVTDAVGSVIEVFVALPSLVIVAFVVVRFLVLPLIHKFDAFHEFIFLAAIGWCLTRRHRREGDRFVARNRCVRGGRFDGDEPDRAVHRGEPASVARLLSGDVLLLGGRGDPLRPAAAGRCCLRSCSRVLLIGLKPVVFRWLIALQGDSTKVAWEAGVRLGQTSEFSLLVAMSQPASALMSDAASHVVQGATVLTFVISTYIVIFRYPSPIAVSDRLRRS